MNKFNYNTEKETNKLDFGDYCLIEQFNYGSDNDMFLYKVIGRSASNAWVNVPVKIGKKEVIHDKMENVLRCVCCGVVEREILKFRESDVKRNNKYKAVK